MGQRVGKGNAYDGGGCIPAIRGCSQQALAMTILEDAVLSKSLSPTIITGELRLSHPPHSKENHACGAHIPRPDVVRHRPQVVGAVSDRMRQSSLLHSVHTRSFLCKDRENTFFEVSDTGSCVRKIAIMF